MNSIIILSLIFFEIIFLILLITKLLNGDNIIHILFEPIIFFILGSLFIYLIIPFFMILFNYKFYKFENYSIHDFFIPNLISFIYIILVIFFYFLILNKSKNKKVKKFSISFKKLENFEIWSLLFLFIFILISTLLLLKIVFLYGLEQYLNNRIILRKGKGIFVLISYLSLLLIPIFLSNIFIKIKNKELKKIYLYLYIFLILIPFILIYMILGNRLPAFIMIILSLFSYWIINLEKLNFKYILKIIIISLSLIFIFTFAGFYRLSRGDFDKINDKYINDIYINIFEYAIIKNFSNFEQLVWLYKHDNRWEPLYGETYLAGFLNFIPRKLYQNKPLGGGPHLKNIISPGSYSLLKSNITSYTTGIITEAYMNFKYLGILIIAFFHSLILIFIKKFFLLINKNLILFIVYLYLLFSISFLILFSEFLGLFSKIIFLTIPYLIIYFLKYIRFDLKRT